MDHIRENTSSKVLLTCGNGKGIREKLLLNSKNGTLQTERLCRSSVLDRVNSFLPQIAQANESLNRQIEESPSGHFDIENVENSEKVIEMDVALFDLENSDSSEEGETSSSSSSEDDSSDEEASDITVETLKLPGDGKRKANIQLVDKEETQPTGTGIERPSM